MLGLFMTVALAAGPSPQPLDYSRPEHWVCRGQAQPCRDDLDATAIAADGSRRIERFTPARNPQIDCFYVYPTVSTAPGLTAPGTAGADERRAVREQVERLSSVCRLYAPVYRQITVTSMRPSSPRASREQAAAARSARNNDIAAAWRFYLEHDNHGRGVVLIGHSQGAGVLMELMQREVDGKPVQAQLVSAVLPGSFITAPAGKDVGGTFKAIPACRRLGQIGCVVVFNSFRAEAPLKTPAPPFGGGVPLCTNPAALQGGTGVLKPYLSTSGDDIIPELTAPQPPFVRGEANATIRTPFVTEPGLFQAECRTGSQGPYLAVIATPSADDRRTGALNGDWVRSDGKREETMGLHLIDLNLAEGNLVELLAAQVAAYLVQSHAGS